MKYLGYAVAVAAILISIVTISYQATNDDTSWLLSNQSCIAEIEKQSELNKQHINGLKEQVAQHHAKISNIEKSSADLNVQFSRIAAILERMDKRTERLEDYFFSRSEGGK